MKKVFLLLSVALMSVGAMAQTWAPAGNKIKTKWAETINPANPLPEYPRPQMVRATWQNLNGLWDYAITQENATDFKSEGQILVPFAVESSLSGVGKLVGKEKALWYERTFTVPKDMERQERIASLWCSGLEDRCLGQWSASGPAYWRIYPV